MKSKLISSMIALFCLQSCGEKVEIDNREDVTVHYNVRKCNYVWADNVKSEILRIEDVWGYLRSPLGENANVKLSEYVLAINTCNIDIPDFPAEYQEFFHSERYNPLHQCPFMALAILQKKDDESERDKTLENKIHQHLKKSHPKTLFSEPQTILAFVDYRTEALTNIEITCSEPLFGVEAGKSLNDYFEIVGYPEYHDFIITTGKQLITAKTTDIGISQYLSYAPLAPAAIYFQPKKGSITSQVTATFTVNLEVNGVKKISATTRPITLEP